MADEPTRWTCILAPDVRVTTNVRGMTLQTAAGHVKLPPEDAVWVANTLFEPGQTENRDLKSGAPADVPAPENGSPLDHLDRQGLVAHRLDGSFGAVVTCIPLRPPRGPRPHRKITGQIALAPQAMLRARDGGLSLEMPGAWARIVVHDTKVLELLPLLAAGCNAEDCADTVQDRPAAWVDAVLCALQWCGIITQTDPSDWALHDLVLHAATRQGYGRKPLGKTGLPHSDAQDRQPTSLRRIDLEIPNQETLDRRDPPFSALSTQRRSRRLHGDPPISAQQLSEFLYRTLHQRDGHRPHPSGGACYPLTGYLALHHSLDVPSGLYRYDAVAHCLDMVAETDRALNRLLTDAAVNAGVSERPQVLLILSARFAKTSSIYEDLSYSLILKEVGAVFQMAMLSAAAMGLAACPLGTGNALAFSALAGLDPLVETSVGELMLGAASDADPNGPPSA